MNTIIVTQNEYTFNVKFKSEGSSDDFQEMLSDFKSSIASRKWNPTLKVWEVSNICEKDLKNWCLVSKWWDTVEWCGQILKAGTYQKASQESSKSYQSEQKSSKSYQSEQKSFKSYNFEDFADLDPVRKEKENWYNILYLTPEAPIELVEKVWKALMLLHHPDKGGDTAKAAAINAAYQKIKENLK